MRETQGLAGDQWMIYDRYDGERLSHDIGELKMRNGECSIGFLSNFSLNNQASESEINHLRRSWN